MSLQTCPDLTEAIPLEPSLGLYLKPVSRIKMNVQLPRLSAPGQSISSWHVMERIKEAVRPDLFLSLKALKIAARRISLEGELETRAACDRALARLKAAHSLDVNGFAERLPVRAAHAALPGPTRHDWEAHFRDAKGVNEMRPGERPDTLHLLELPTRWFGGDKSGESGGPPSEKILRKAFGSFGKIRRLEAIRRSTATSGDGTFRKTGSLQGEGTFEAYVQYEEYVEFSIAMDALRGKKLLYKVTDREVYSADIQVDFDRTNYLSDRCIKLREAETKKSHRASPPERTKSSKEDGCKNSKPTAIEKENSSAVKERDKEKTELIKTDEKNLNKKENSAELEKSQKEAKLLLKELLRRAEKHKRKTDAESEKSPPQKELKELKKPLRAEQSDTCSDRDNLKAKRVSSKERASSKGDKSKSPRAEKRSPTLDKSSRKRSESQTLQEKEKKRTFCEEWRGGAKRKRTEGRHEKISSSSNHLLDEELRRKRLILQERILKEKLLKNLKMREEERMREREKLRRELAGRRGLLKSVLVGALNKKS